MSDAEKLGAERLAKALDSLKPHELANLLALVGDKVCSALDRFGRPDLAEKLRGVGIEACEFIDYALYEVDDVAFIADTTLYKIVDEDEG